MRFSFPLLAIFILLAFQSISQKAHRDYVDGQLFVKLRSYYHPKTGEAMVPDKYWDAKQLPFSKPLSANFGIRKLERAFKTLANDALNMTLRLEFDNIYASESIIAALQNDPLVEYVERVPLDRLHFDPNDPQFGQQWYLNQINAQLAWNFFTTGSNIVIAITDNAIERQHPDISPNLWVNPGEIPGNGIDDDGNGYIDDINGWDVADDNAFPDPPNANFNHGTHVAGIASAATNNAIGIASIGFSCKIMCVKVSRNAGDPRQVSNGYEGILYAASNGAHIINMSWGGTGQSQTNLNVINFALERGCILVASAGNDNVQTPNFPAAYPGVVSVASTTVSDAKSSFSNYGPWVKISAPGSSILSTIPFGTYGTLSGTSMAAPLVAGMLGLMKSLNPGLPNEDLLNCMYSTAKNIDNENPFFNGLLGAGRIDAGAAMSCVSNTLDREPRADFIANRTNIVAGATVTFTDRSAFNPTTWSWSFPGGTPASFNGRTPPPILYNAPGVFPVSLTVTNANGSNQRLREEYINVITPPSCDRINLPNPPNWTLTNYTTGANGSNGFVNGVNSRSDRQKAMFFDLSATANTHLTRFAVGFGRAASNGLVTFRIFDGTDGIPGPQLFSVVRQVSAIREDVLAGRLTFIELNQSLPLPASRRIFISVDISNLQWDNTPRDTLSILSNVAGQSSTTDVWEQTFAGTWLRYGSPGSWALTNLSLAIHPFFTGNLTTATLSPKEPEICSGSQITFNANGSQLAPGAETAWLLEGSIPANYSQVLEISPFFNQPGQFKVFFGALGACEELRIDSTIVSVKASPDLNVTAAKNPICLGETTTLTASGANTYTWSPATGLSATTGATVQANPQQTTSYTITGSDGECTSSSVIELIVRDRTTSVLLSATTTEISQPTEVTFTAAATNEGSSPIYEFRVNNEVRQSGPGNVFVATVVPNDEIICRLTSSEPCVENGTVESNKIVMTDPSLPVTLLNFSGEVAGKTHVLTWKTAQEQNSLHFDVEQSADGQGFVAIGRVAAAGNSFSLRRYEYINHKLLNGPNFYRLRMVDRDGSFAYSNVVLLRSPSVATLQSQLFPNPTSALGRVTLQITSVQQPRLSISLTNVNGQVLRSWMPASVNGMIQIQINATGLPAGVYYFIIRNDAGEVLGTQRWVIEK